MTDQQPRKRFGPPVALSTDHKILPEALRAAGHHDITVQEILELLENPVVSWPEIHQRRTLANDRIQIVLSNDDSTILRVAPRGQDNHRAPAPTDDLRLSGTVDRRRSRRSADASRPRFEQDMASFLERCRAHGLEVQPGSRHQRVVRPGYPGVVVIPTTPSDHRWAQNSARDIRHELGVDIRRAPST